MADAKFRCQDCQAVIEEKDLKDLTRVFCRVEPGDVMPHGECPHCGAACFPVKEYSEPYLFYNQMGSRVLMVAVPGECGDWAAYCDAVRGICHANEWQTVAKRGDKIPKKWATFLFPQFDPAKYRE
jgi:hypothetical protein